MWTKHAVFGIIATGAMFLGSCSHGTPRARAPVATAALPSASVEPGWDDQACLELMQERDNWRFAGGFLSGIGGAGAISAAGTAEETDSKWARWGLGIAAGLSGAAGAAAIVVAANKAEAFETYCQIDNAPPARPVDPTAGLGLPAPGTNPPAARATPPDGDAGPHR